VEICRKPVSHNGGEFVFGTRLTDCHSGFRAFSRKLLTTVPFLLNSDDFVFDSQMIAQAAYMKFRIAEIPVQARYFPEASSVNFRVSTIYGFKTLWLVLKFSLQSLHLARFKIFDKTLPEVVSKYYHGAIFSGAAGRGSGTREQTLVADPGGHGPERTGG
jgi:hypothetical protein